MLNAHLYEKLCQAIPPACKILAFGKDADNLGKHYKTTYPDAVWHISESDITSVKALPNNFEVIVLYDVLEHLDNPSIWLSLLKEKNPQALLVGSIFNMAHVSVFEKLLMADLTYSETIHRFFTPSSVYKLILDSGWLPNMSHAFTTQPADSTSLEGLVSAAQKRGVPPDTAIRNFTTERLIFSCKPREDSEMSFSASSGRFDLSIIVPVNNPLQFELNLLASPGLKDARCQLIPVTAATSAADGFETGHVKAEANWVVYCHQDVYFPKGSVKTLLSQLAKIPAQEAQHLIIGFAGISAASLGGEKDKSHAGLVIDRKQAFDNPASDSGISLDEFAVVLHKDCVHKIDPTLGWHTWATDLCLQSILRSPQAHYTKILRVPLFHNSLNDWTLPESYYQSAATLLNKYPELAKIETLCGALGRK